MWPLWLKHSHSRKDEWTACDSCRSLQYWSRVKLTALKAASLKVMLFYTRAFSPSAYLNSGVTVSTVCSHAWVTAGSGDQTLGFCLCEFKFVSWFVSTFRIPGPWRDKIYRYGPTGQKYMLPVMKMRPNHEWLFWVEKTSEHEQLFQIAGDKKAVFQPRQKQQRLARKVANKATKRTSLLAQLQTEQLDKNLCKQWLKAQACTERQKSFQCSQHRKCTEFYSLFSEVSAEVHPCVTPLSVQTCFLHVFLGFLFSCWLHHT